MTPKEFGFDQTRPSPEKISVLELSPCLIAVHPDLRQVDSMTNLTQPENLGFDRELSILSEIVWSYDQDQIDPKKRGGMWEEILSEEKVSSKKEAVIKHIVDILNKDEDTLVAGPLMGAYPLLMHLINQPQDFDERIIPIVIAGSTATTTGDAEILIPLPDELLDENKQIIKVDDIDDSCVTSAQLVAERRKERTGREDSQLKNHIDNLKKKPLEEGQEQESFNNRRFVKPHQALARAMREENVITAAVFCKNAPFYQALRQETNEALKIGEDVAWAQRQKDLLEVARQLEEDQWVVGAGLLDTKIEIAKIYHLLDEQTRALAKKKCLDENLKRLILRLSASKPALLVFKGTDENKQIIQKEMVDLLTEFIDDY